MYLSSRNKNIKAKASEAIIKGLADDGGLFVPESIPTINILEKKYLNMSYKDFAKEILSLFLDDFSLEEISVCVESAYNEKFKSEEIIKLHSFDKTHFIELFHGQTSAFKDMALSILPHLIQCAKKKNNIKSNTLIMTATSGDTGKAALEAFKDIKGIKIVVFYPADGVSEVQKQQMVSQRGNNLKVFAINGNFDDAQNAVKKAFSSADFNEKCSKLGYSLSSANSINIGRLIPQIIYYFYSYFKLLNKGIITYDDKINIAVPTGNFGNILAAYYAFKMGLPVNRLFSASNRNRVLSDFFNNMGTYDIRRTFYKTASPSMDILISSNFERLIYHASKGDTNYVKSKMHDLKDKAKYTVDIEKMAELDIFSAEFSNDSQTSTCIKEIYEKFAYLIDPHTAVCKYAYDKYQKRRNDKNHVLIASTASPFKFPDFVLKAISTNKNNNVSGFKALNELSKLTKISIPNNLRQCQFDEILYKETIEIKDLEASVLEFLK